MTKAASRHIGEIISRLPRRGKQALLLALDAFLVPFSLWAGFALRYGHLWPQALNQVWWLLPLSLAVVVPIFVRLGLYRAIVRYTDHHALSVIIKAATLSTLVLVAVVAAIRPEAMVPRSAWVIFWLSLVAFLVTSRLLGRAWLLSALFQEKEKAAVIGGGREAAVLALALKQGEKFSPVALFSEDKDILGRDVFGVPTLPLSRLEETLAQGQIRRVFLASPYDQGKEKMRLAKRISEIPCQIHPGASLQASGQLPALGIEEVLCRQAAPMDEGLLAQAVAGKVVLVTGAGGSIGGALAQRILCLSPKALVLLDHSEAALWEVSKKLGGGIPVLASVLSRARLEAILQRFRVETVFHAAAYKHVPMVEEHPLSGIENNILGTLYVFEAARAAGVGRLVFISTDKSVFPKSVMGASKRVGEMLLLTQADRFSSPRVCVVRFGNVFASSGSVVPIFRAQIAQGGPVTVTDPEVTRYFMSLSEAVGLVLQAASLARGGEIFVLDMGEPVRIIDLARRMIHLSGFSVKDEDHAEGDIEIKITGLREGEKTHEALSSSGLLPTRHPAIFQASEPTVSWERLEEKLMALREAISREDESLALALLWEMAEELPEALSFR